VNRYFESDVDIPAVIGDYPTLRATTDQADLQLPAVTAVNNFEDLQAMSLTGNYYLTADIDASTANFTPIGTSTSNPFTGTFDGKGYTISNLTISEGAGTYNALFGAVKGDVQIANVTLSDISVTGGDWTGALVGYALASATGEVTIQNCHSSGTLTAGANGSDFGGLVGIAAGDAGGNQVYIYDCSSSCNLVGVTFQTRNWGGLIGDLLRSTVSNSFATGTITGGTLSAEDHGGLVGKANTSSIIAYCYSTGAVNGNSNLGGLVGKVIDSATVDKSYVTGNVTGTSQQIGGFVGDNNGDIQDCYAWGDVDGGAAGIDVGGFVGAAGNVADIYSQCYSIGAVTGASTVGGFAGTGAEIRIIPTLGTSTLSGIRNTRQDIRARVIANVLSNSSRWISATKIVLGMWMQGSGGRM
jgi:hypothetical protein